jgi:hypothetical protein
LVPFVLGSHSGIIFRTVEGQLVGRSGKIKYLSRTTYICGNRGCSSSSSSAEGEEAYVRVRGLADKDGPEPREECQICGHQLQEQFSRRDISTKASSSISSKHKMNVLTGAASKFLDRAKFAVFLMKTVI